MTVDDKMFLRKMLADLAVFPAIQIPPSDMARCFRLIIIKALEEPGMYVPKKQRQEDLDEGDEGEAL